VSSKCNQCGGDITWKKPFTQGDRPLNLDNTVHTCKRADTTTPGTTSNEITSQSIIDECEAFRVKFGPIESDTRFDSLARIYISRMMRR